MDIGSMNPPSKQQLEDLLKHQEQLNNLQKQQEQEQIDAQNAAIEKQAQAQSDAERERF